ncbi:uncharacterized protein V1518DRAFT_417694 [Limtongia smithiae]|uniref:uncharacterized protein n=1 Tax=Limtongia smithiae TaxID=1125753 RepID=UPI0034CD11E5
MHILSRLLLPCTFLSSIFTFEMDLVSSLEAASTISGPCLTEVSVAKISRLAKDLKAHIYIIPDDCIPWTTGKDPKGILKHSESNWSPKAYIIHPINYAHSTNSTQPDANSKSVSRSTYKGLLSTSCTKEKVPRPRNAFIIYRGTKHDEVMRQGNISNTTASRVIAKMWSEEPLEIKDHFRRLAMEESLRHKMQYPEYRYSPRKPGEKLRRVRRKDVNSLVWGSSLDEVIKSSRDLDYHDNSLPCTSSSSPDSIDFTQVSKPPIFYNCDEGSPSYEKEHDDASESFNKQPPPGSGTSVADCFAFSFDAHDMAVDPLLTGNFGSETMEISGNLWPSGGISLDTSLMSANATASDYS